MSHEKTTLFNVQEINAETREKIQSAILEAYEAPETEESAE